MSAKTQKTEKRKKDISVSSPVQATSRIGKEYYQCSLIVLDCIKDKYMIQQLTKLAEEQKSNFIRIFPWESSCKKGDKLYVAIDLDVFADLKETLRSSKPLICGWARVSFEKTDKTEGSQKLAYIIEIAASTNKNKFQGIGTDIVKEVEKEDIDFIKLTALPTALSFYQKIGFYEQSNIPYLFKEIREKPKNAYIQFLINEKKERDRLLKEENAEIFDEILDELDSEDQKRFHKFLNKASYHTEAILDVYHNVPEEDRIEEIIKLIT